MTIERLYSGHIIDTDSLEQMGAVYNQLKILFIITTTIICTETIFLIGGLFIYLLTN